MKHIPNPTSTIMRDEDSAAKAREAFTIAVNEGSSTEYILREIETLRNEQPGSTR